jgi:hypothetical protein
VCAAACVCLCVCARTRVKFVLGSYFSAPSELQISNGRVWWGVLPLHCMAVAVLFLMANRQ